MSYVQGYSCPKLQLQETEQSEKYGEYSSQYKKNNFMLNAGQDKRISIYQTHFVFVPLFSKHTLTRQIIILSTKNSQEFLASKVSVLRRNKATNSTTSNRPFFSCTESPLVLGNLFKIFRLDITFAREVCHLGIKMKKI